MASHVNPRDLESLYRRMAVTCSTANIPIIEISSRKYSQEKTVFSVTYNVTPRLSGICRGINS